MLFENGKKQTEIDLNLNIEIANAQQQHIELFVYIKKNEMFI